MTEQKRNEWSEATQAKCAWAFAAIFVIWWALSGNWVHLVLAIVCVVIGGGLTIKVHQKRHEEDQNQQT